MVVWVREILLKAEACDAMRCKTSPKASNGSFRKLGVPYFGILVISILLFRVLH